MTGGWMRRSRTMAVLATMLVTTLTMGADAQTEPNPTPGGTFIDEDGNVHEGFIEAIAEVGITKGCNPPTNDWYCPTDPVTRGQMAAFLNRSLNLEPANTGHFGDDDGSVFETDIDALAAAGITKGCNPPANDRFCPESFVTRGQMAAFLVRGFQYTASTGDVFIDDDSSQFESDIERLAAAGVTSGCNPPDNDRYCPAQWVERAQMASFLGRALALDPREPAPTMMVAPYFLLDEVGHDGRTGPFVAPFQRRVAESAGVAEASIEALLEGPSTDEQASTPAVSSEIPDGVALRSITIDDGVATIDFSDEFDANRPSAAAAMRVAQVVFTLTRFESVSSVAFLQEGVDVAVPTGAGGVVTRPVGRADYRTFEPAIAVESPAYGAIVQDDIRVAGEAAVFDRAFRFALADADGRIIAEGGATTGPASGWAPFAFTIRHDLTATQRGELIVWATADDGTQIDIRRYPLVLQP